MSVCGIDQNSAAPIDTFQRIGHVHPICSENNHVAFSCLLLCPCTGVRAKIGDKIRKCLWPSGIGYDDANDRQSGNDVQAYALLYLRL